MTDAGAAHIDGPARTGPPVGLVLGSEIPPDRLAAVAAAAEDHGFAEVWLAEDYFMTGGIAGAGIALGATSRMPVGLGVVSAVARHPALLAMEVATLAHAHPGRVHPAVGLGVPAWLDQMGLRPDSALRAVREAVTSLRALLGGEELDEPTSTFHFDGVRLAYPLDVVPPIRLGVAGPRMLRLSGEVGDGTLLSVLAGPDYVRWARDRIAEGAARAGRDPAHHEVVVFAIHSSDRDGDAARAMLRPTVAFYLAAGGRNALTDAYGISDDLEAMLDAGGVDAVRDALPDAWVDDLTVSGTPEECATRVRDLLDAGADRVCLFPVPADRTDDLIATAGARILPALSDGS